MRTASASLPRRARAVPFFAGIALVLLFAPAPLARDAATLGHGAKLRYVFGASGVDAPPDIAPLLGEMTSSGAVLTDDHGIVYVGYLDSECDGGRLRRLRVIERAAGGAWRQVAFAEGTGSIQEVRRVGCRLLVGVHRSPSAQNTWVLGPELALERVLKGHVLESGVVADRFALVVVAQPRWGAVREARLEVHDLKTGSHREVFPPERPGPLTAALRARAAECFGELGQDWCRENNHPCDPRRLESWVGELAERDGAVAFFVGYAEDPLDHCGPITRIAYVMRDAASRTAVVEEAGALDVSANARDALERLLAPQRRPPRHD